MIQGSQPATFRVLPTSGRPLDINGNPIQPSQVGGASRLPISEEERRRLREAQAKLAEIRAKLPREQQGMVDDQMQMIANVANSGMVAVALAMANSLLSRLMISAAEGGVGMQDVRADEISFAGAGEKQHEAEKHKLEKLDAKIFFGTDVLVLTLEAVKPHMDPLASYPVPEAAHT